MHRAGRVSRRLGLQHLAQGTLEKPRKRRKMYRPESMLRQSSNFAGRFFCQK